MTLRDKWLEALRSGKYKQGTGQLKSTLYKEPRYCCLGVLCDVYEDGHWHGELYATEGELGPKTSDATPPSDITDEAGISFANMGKLIRANDQEGKSFEQIADMIESFIP